MLGVLLQKILEIQKVYLNVAFRNMKIQHFLTASKYDSQYFLVQSRE